MLNEWIGDWDNRNIVVGKGENMSAPNILIIDDDPDFVEITKAILETKQYEVSFAYNSQDGFAKMAEEMPDAIILDVMMGKGAEGFIFARKMRKDPRFDKIPILMLTSMREQTGFDFPGDRIHAKFLPVDDYIEKGIEPQVLLEKIEQQLARKSSG
jgi:DNA-binding response OmpR family regulator